jgi:hypothetical protein
MEIRIHLQRMQRPRCPSHSPITTIWHVWMRMFLKTHQEIRHLHLIGHGSIYWLNKLRRFAYSYVTIRTALTYYNRILKQEVLNSWSGWKTVLFLHQKAKRNPIPTKITNPNPKKTNPNPTLQKPTKILILKNQIQTSKSKKDHRSCENNNNRLPYQHTTLTTKINKAK